MARTINSIQRAFTIVEFLASSPQGMGVLELAAKSDLPPATTHRILQTLFQAGYVKQDHLTERYLLTTKMFEVGSRKFREVDLHSLAVPIMKELTKRTEESSYLIVLDGQEGLCVELIESKERHRVCCRVGERIPLHCTAAGKILLAFGSVKIKDLSLEHYTPNTITQQQVLEEHLNVVRENGVATDMDEWEIGIRCIAAPIRNHRGETVAAIAISGPTTRLTEQRMKEVKMVVIAAANQISAMLGFASKAIFYSREEGEEK